MRRLALPVFVALAFAALVYALALPLKLGAHPFWSSQVIFWGAPLGLVVGIVASRLQYLPSLLGLMTLTAAAYAVAYVGKARFAASFAEDAFGGQMWFFGWHAVIALAVATVLVTSTRLVRA